MATTTVSITTGVNDQDISRTGATWSPTAGAITRTTNFGTIFASRTFSGGNYTVRVGLLSFNTASIPDDDFVASAVLTLAMLPSTDGGEGRSLSGEAYDWAGNAAADWSDVVLSTAFDPVLLTTWGGPGVALHNFSVKTPDTIINKSGTTDFRLHVSGDSAPAGVNEASFAAFENVSGYAVATLSITHYPRPTYRSRSSAANDLDASLSIPFPTDPVAAQVNDVLLALLEVEGGSGATIVAGGWTEAGRVNLGTDVASAVLWKVIGTSEPSNYLFSFDQARSAIGEIVAYKDAAIGGPIDVISSQANATPSTSAEAASATLSRADGRLIFAAAGKGTISFAAPSGMTERVDISG